MSLQDYINTDIEFLKRILNVRYGHHYNDCSLDQILMLTERYKDDVKAYILYPINPLYDYFVIIGITDEDEMRTILATLFYLSIKNKKQ